MNYEKLEQLREEASHEPLLEIQESRADDALDMIDECPKHINDHLEYVIVQLAKSGVDLKTADVKDAVGAINDALSDLFHASRIKLMDIAGWRPDYEPNPKAFKSVSQILFESLKPPTIQQVTAFMRPLNNPATKPELFEGDTSMKGDDV